MVWDDPVFAKRKVSHFLSATETYSDAVKQAVYLRQFSKEHGIDNPLDIM